MRQVFRAFAFFRGCGSAQLMFGECVSRSELDCYADIETSTRFTTCSEWQRCSRGKPNRQRLSMSRNHRSARMAARSSTISSRTAAARFRVSCRSSRRAFRPRVGRSSPFVTHRAKCALAIKVDDALGPRTVPLTFLDRLPIGTIWLATEWLPILWGERCTGSRRSPIC